MLMMLK
jgi:hypothetical protein